MLSLELLSVITPTLVLPSSSGMDHPKKPFEYWLPQKSLSLSLRISSTSTWIAFSIFFGLPNPSFAWRLNLTPVASTNIFDLILLVWLPILTSICTSLLFTLTDLTFASVNIEAPFFSAILDSS